MPGLDTLKDDFSSGTVPDPARWPLVNGGTVGGGQCTITTPSSGVNEIRGAAGYDLRQSYFGMRIISGPLADPLADPEIRVWSTVYGGVFPALHLPLYNGNIVLRYHDKAGDPTDVAAVAQPAPPFYVACGLEGNLLKWFSSPDSATWTLLGTFDITTDGMVASDFANVFGSIISQGFGGAPANSVIDNVNIFTTEPIAPGAYATGYLRSNGRLLTTTSVGTQVANGFLRDSAGAIAVTTSTAGATWQVGFLRGPAPAGLALGPLVIAPGGGGAYWSGFVRDAAGVLAVTTSTAGLAYETGYQRDSTGRLAVAGLA